MASLGKMGRFGNQVFQYAFLRLAANVAALQYQCPEWAGHHLFGLDDPPVSQSLPPAIEISANGESVFDVFPDFIPYVEKLFGKRASRIGPDALRKPAEPADLLGFFQFHTRHYLPHRDLFRSLFVPRDDMREWLREPIDLLRTKGRTIVAIHMRAGDYRWLPQLGFTMSTPPSRWIEWLDENWGRLDNPVLFICSDTVSRYKDAFRKYNPVTADDLHIHAPQRLRGKGLGYYRDYYVLTQADVVGVSNSSFSFSAAMLNERARTFIRPSWNNGVELIPFDPWDSDPLMYIGSRYSTYMKDYDSMVAVARHTGGIRNEIATRFLYHPVGASLIFGIRMKLAHGLAGWPGVARALLPGRS